MSTIIQGDCLNKLKELPDSSIQCCITSPPYWGLRDYGSYNQLGLEKTPEEYVENMVKVFREAKRVLKNNGTLWLNLGDSYVSNHPTGTKDSDTNWKHGELSKGYMARSGGAGIGVLKPKDIVGIPWRVAFALQADGWYLRQDIIWHKPNPMPESVKDRCTKAHEYIFLLSKNQHYYFDQEAIKEPTKTKDHSYRNRDITKLNNTPGRLKMAGLKTNHYDTRNKRSVWTVTTKPFKEAHFATFPEDLIVPCVLAGSAQGDTILDPFFGAGTVGVVAKRNRREYIGIELNGDYVEIAKKRIVAVSVNLF